MLMLCSASDQMRSYSRVSFSSDHCSSSGVTDTGQGPCLLLISCYSVSLEPTFAAGRPLEIKTTTGKPRPDQRKGDNCVFNVASYKRKIPLTLFFPLTDAGTSRFQSWTRRFRVSTVTRAAARGCLFPLSAEVWFHFESRRCFVRPIILLPANVPRAKKAGRWVMPRLNDLSAFKCSSSLILL